MDLKDKVALVTGASSGIGKAIALELDKAGMKLILNARSEDELKEVASHCKQAKVFAVSITEPESAQKLLDFTLDSFGQLDVLVNNAGMMTVGKIEDINIDKICLMARLNVESVYRMAYTVLKHFKKTGSGFLINTSSISGIKTSATYGAYSGTKHAVEAFTDSLRMELAGTGIKVAAIAPGTVDTGLYDDWDKENESQIKAAGALKPEDIARCVHFVLKQPDGVLVPRLLVVPRDQPI